MSKRRDECGCLQSSRNGCPERDDLLEEEIDVSVDGIKIGVTISGFRCKKDESYNTDIYEHYKCTIRILEPETKHDSLRWWKKEWKVSSLANRFVERGDSIEEAVDKCNKRAKKTMKRRQEKAQREAKNEKKIKQRATKALEEIDADEIAKLTQ